MSDNISIFPPTGVQRVKKYLSDRGISTEAAYLDSNHLEICGPVRIKELLGYSLGSEMVGLCIHFPDTDYFQLRPICHEKYKILCPSGETPRAYLPTATDWGGVKGRLIITESPLKALTWTDFGHHALAAGGVSTVYMARKRAWCEGFPHAAIQSGAITEVWISFDSDLDSNHDVARSARQLNSALTELYPKLTTRLKIMPRPSELGLHDYEKDTWGVDDFRVHIGDDEFSVWAGDDTKLTLREPEKDEIREHLDALDERYIYCRRPMQIIELATGEEYSVPDFGKWHEGGREVVTEEGRKIPIAPMWCKRDRENRPEVRQKAYHPGAPLLYDGDYNDWRPSDLLPVRGDVSPWLDLLRDSIPHEETRELLIQCMAFQVQNRGVRLPKIVYLTGYQQGTGKSTQCEIMRRIIGHENTGWVTRHELESNFNADWTTKELVILDDCPKLNKDLWPRIKNHVTSDVVTVQRKFRDGRQQKNYSVIYVSANTNDVLPIENDERRVLMVEFAPAKLHREKGDEYWNDFHTWLDQDAGFEAIAYYLQNVVNLDDFDPNFHPPNTELKQSASMLALTDEETWLTDFVENWQEYGIPAGRKVITGAELWALYAGEEVSPMNDKQYKRFSRIVGKTRLLPNARGASKQVTLSDRKRAVAMWLPRVERTEEPSNGVLRDNIEKYQIKLNSGCTKL